MAPSAGEMSAAEPGCMALSEGFAAIASLDAHTLILGSLPGRTSLTENEYYAHPQNAFWRIMNSLYGTDGDYEQRCRRLTANGVAVWDVLSASVRPGSLDADIDMATAIPNDIVGFLARHAAIRRIAFNGRKAQQLFFRFVDLPVQPQIETVLLPSTSPAYASMSFSGKLDAWQRALKGE